MKNGISRTQNKSLKLMILWVCFRNYDEQYCKHDYVRGVDYYLCCMCKNCWNNNNF